jgi:hypothetical protein
MEVPRALSVGLDPDWMLLPEIFTFKNLKKGVYYNPYLTINDPDTEGGIVSFSNYTHAI